MPGTAKPALGQLAAWASALKLDDVAETHYRVAQAIVLDVIWAAIAYADDDRAIAARQTLSHESGDAVSIPGTHQRASAAEAAMAFAMAAAASDCSDTHAPTGTHPGIVLVPALMAALEAGDSDFRDLLRGLVVGYEIMARLGRALITPGFADMHRTTAITAPVAAAMAVATALRLSETQIASAGSLAANTAAGLNEWIHAGTDEHPLHAGLAARNAVTCALLARAGMTATPSALDGPAGLLAAHGARDSAPILTVDLGAPDALGEAAFKPAPACFYAQAPIQAALNVAGYGLEAEDILAVRISVGHDAFQFPGCATIAPPETRQDAVMSIAFGAAVALLRGKATPADWDDYRHPELRKIIQRTTVAHDSSLDQSQGAELDIESAKGPLSARQVGPVAMAFDRVAQRLTATIPAAYGPDGASAIVSHVRSGAGRVRDLAAVYAPPLAAGGVQHISGASR